MKRFAFSLVLVLFLLMSGALGVKNYRGKVWFLKPAFEYKNLGESPFLIFKTPIKCKIFKVSYETNKIFVLFKDELKIFSPDFSLIKDVKNLKERMGVKSWKSEIGFMALKDSGDEVFFGIPDRENKKYLVFSYYVKNDKLRLLLTLDKKHFPGVAPIKKVLKSIKEDPSFFDDYFSFVFDYSDFEDAYYDVGKLYMWFKPDYSLYFGGLYVYDIYEKKLSFPYKKFDKLYGFSDGDYLYSRIIDDNASEVEDSLYVRLYKKKFKIKNVNFERGVAFSGETAAYVTKDGYINIRNVFKDERPLKIKAPAWNFKIINISFSGNRLFIDTEKNGLKYYDRRDGKFYTLLSAKNKKGWVSGLYSCIDGEFILFALDNHLWAGYLPDEMAPILRVESRDLFRNKTFNDKITFNFEARDTCFVSGVGKTCVSFKGKNFSSKGKVTVSLNEGENILNFFIKDRAGNVRKVVKKVFYEKPLGVSLEEISKEPQKYKGKFLLLKGYAWGWMAKNETSKKYYKLPLAKGNTARTRNEGTFSDGKYTAFIPISPIDCGMFKIIAKIKILGSKWRIVPVKFIKLK